MEQQGVGHRELARRSGKNISTVSQTLAGKTWGDKYPPLDDIEAYARALGVSEGLLRGVEPFPDVPAKRVLTDDELFAKIGAGYVEDIPVIDDVLVSAGPGSAIPQDIDDTLPQRSRRRHFKHLRTLAVTGRCLEPELRHGDFVVIDRDRAAEPGKLVVAVRDEEEALIKRLVERDGLLYLATNDGRPDLPVDDHVRILGPVVAYQRMLW